MSPAILNLMDRGGSYSDIKKGWKGLYIYDVGLEQVPTMPNLHNINVMSR